MKDPIPWILPFSLSLRHADVPKIYRFATFLYIITVNIPAQKPGMSSLSKTCNFIIEEIWTFCKGRFVTFSLWISTSIM